MPFLLKKIQRVYRARNIFKKSKWVVNCVGNGYEKAFVTKAITPGDACDLVLGKLGNEVEIMSAVPYNKLK